MADVVIASAVRTPIATAYKGSLVGTSALELSQVAVGAALERSGVPGEAIEDLVMGESMQGGGNIARYTAIELGLDNVPGAAIQRWCASGMSAVNYLAANIAAGMVECGIAGGVEALSTAPPTKKPGPGGGQAPRCPPGPPQTDHRPLHKTDPAAEETSEEVRRGCSSTLNSAPSPSGTLTSSASK